MGSGHIMAGIAVAAFLSPAVWSQAAGNAAQPEFLPDSAVIQRSGRDADGRVNFVAFELSGNDGQSLAGRLRLVPPPTAAAMIYGKEAINMARGEFVIGDLCDDGQVWRVMVTANATVGDASRLADQVDCESWEASS